jgi:glycosyltransferase involved in cell wall biosynthesis
LFHPKYWPYVQALKPRYVVFHAYDAFPLMDKNWSELDASYLANLSQRADILSATTPGVVATFPASCQSKARILENGADVGKFRAAEHLECPEALRAIPRPRIGYIGTVSRRTDFASINYVARKHPDWHWILLGDVVEYAIEDDPSVLRDYQASRTLPNVHYLDAVPSDDVVAYMGHMDINTICYRVSKQNWVSMGYPVKLHEYFAVGKPVISAPLEIIRDRFASAVELASSPSEWESAIENVLSTGGRGSRDLRLSISEANSWDQRVDQLEGWLFEMLRSPHTSTPAS